MPALGGAVSFRMLTTTMMRVCVILCLVYGLSVQGAVGQPLIIGHRGAPSFGGENTLASFAQAIDLGADGIELDLVLSRDGQLIVFHDWTLNRLVGVETLEAKFPDRSVTVDGETVWRVRDFDADELRGLPVTQRGPRGTADLNQEALTIVVYEEALRFVAAMRMQHPNLVLYTEVKTSAEFTTEKDLQVIVDRLIEALRSTGEHAHAPRHWIQSFDGELMRLIAQQRMLDGFRKSLLLSCEPGLVTSANPVILDLAQVSTEQQLVDFLREEVRGRGCDIVHGWKLMWWHLGSERGIDCLRAARLAELDIHAFTFRDHRYAQDYERRPVLVPRPPVFGSASEELGWFVAKGFDALMSDDVVSALEARRAASLLMDDR